VEDRRGREGRTSEVERLPGNDEARDNKGSKTARLPPREGPLEVTHEWWRVPCNNSSALTEVFARDTLFSLSTHDPESCFSHPCFRERVYRRKGGSYQMADG
jgi:hypothetical protein